MRKEVWGIAGAVLTVSNLSLAWADGMPPQVRVAPAVEEYNGWTGLYFGAGGGFSSVDHSGSTHVERTKKTEKCDNYGANDCIIAWAPPHATTTSSSSSFFGDDEWDPFGTLQIGYDHRIHHHLLIGAFADVDWYDNGDSFKFADGNSSSDLDWVWSVGGRLGALVKPHVLLYGVAGYTQASLDNAVHINNGPILLSDDQLDGWFIGAGSEVHVRRGISLKFEYRYADYDGAGASGTTTTTSAHYNCPHPKKCRDIETTKARSDHDLEVQSIRALVVFRLDKEERVVQPLK